MFLELKRGERKGSAGLVLIETNVLGWPHGGILGVSFRLALALTAMNVLFGPKMTRFVVFELLQFKQAYFVDLA